MDLSYTSLCYQRLCN